MISTPKRRQPSNGAAIAVETLLYEKQ